MRCSDCNAEVRKGTHFCGDCGKPFGFGGDVASGVMDTPGLADIPEPPPSRDLPGPRVLTPTDLPAPEPRSAGSRALCSMCLGAFPESSMTMLDGKAFCGDCSPMTGRRCAPEPEGMDGLLAPSASSSSPADFGAPSILSGQSKEASGGLKGLFLVLMTLMVVGGGYVLYTVMGEDRIDRLTSGADDDRVDAHLLLSKYQAGETLTYSAKVRMQMEGEVSTGLRSGEMEMDATVGGLLMVDVLSVDSRQNADLRLRLEGFHASGEVAMDGRKFDLADAPGFDQAFAGMNGITVDMTVDPFGEPIGEPVASGGDASLHELFESHLSNVPRNEVRVGDTWTAVEKMPVRNMGGGAMPVGEISVTVRFEVLGYKKHAGRDCMVIGLEGEMEGPGGSSVGTSGPSLNMDVAMKGVIFFDYEKGQMMRSSMDIDVEMGASQGVSMEVRIKMQLDVELK